jgi:hypothetical protein
LERQFLFQPFLKQRWICQRFHIVHLLQKLRLLCHKAVRYNAGAVRVKTPVVAVKRSVQVLKNLLPAFVALIFIRV